jgi:small subunit ribosomal protein S21
MAKIEVKQDEHIRDALRRFKKLCDHEGILSRSRRRNFYEKPSERRRREAIERMKNIRRAERIRLGLVKQRRQRRASF